MDPDWLENHLKQNPKAIQHEILSDRILLPSILFTSSTKELQTFLLKHVKTKGAFTQPIEMMRQEIGK